MTTITSMPPDTSVAGMTLSGDSPATSSLAGRVALITGAAQGIGLACARRFLADGAQVMLADIDEAAGRAARADLGAGGACAFTRCDVGQVSDGVAAVAATVEAFGRLDILVNNAGITRAQTFLDLTEEDFDAVMAVNLRGAVFIGQAAARAMIEAGSAGSIVNMSSVNAELVIANLVAYNVSKGGVNQLTRAMALNLAPYGIRVNAIGPGTILTELAKAAVLGSDEARRTILSRTPMGRCGEPEEIAAIARFLASDEASYITGQTIYADGGRLILNYTVPVE